ncbi:MAG: glucose-6-phosphate dehydrogenase, partial [Anaerolineae bacterium]
MEFERLLEIVGDDEFRQRLRSGVDRFSRRCQANDPDWAAFAPHLSYLAADPTESTAYEALSGQLSSLDQEWRMQANRILYLATPPAIVEPILRQ